MGDPLSVLVVIAYHEGLEQIQLKRLLCNLSSNWGQKIIRFPEKGMLETLVVSGEFRGRILEYCFSKLQLDD